MGEDEATTADMASGDTAPPGTTSPGTTSPGARRRRSRIALAGSALVLVLLVGIGVHVGAPLPGLGELAQQVDAPDDAGPSALDDGVVRGNLASDTRWQTELRERTLRERRFAVADEGLLPRTVDDVRVIYAADVDRWRVALVEVTGWPSVKGGGRRQLWYSGPRGAAVDAVRPGPASAAGPDADTVLWGVDGAEAPAGPVGRIAYVAVTAGGPAPRVTESPAISPRGTLTWPVRTLEPVAPGVYEDVRDVGWGSYWVLGPHGPPHWSRTGLDPVHPPALARGIGTPVHAATSDPVVAGTPSEAAAWVARGFGRIRAEYGVDVAALPRRLVWTGRVRDRSVTVVAVLLPNGATLVALLDRTQDGGSIETAVLPAGPLDRIMLASSNLSQDTTYVEVLAPRGTTRLRFEDHDRVTTVPVPAAAAPGLVSVRHDFVAPGDGVEVRVTALDAAGAPIASTGVNTGLVTEGGLHPPDPS